MDYKVISQQFVDYYYGTFNKNYQNQVTQRENLSQVYTDESLFSCQDIELAGKVQIMQYLLKESISQQVKRPINYNSIPSENNCILIQVLGDTLFNDGDNQDEIQPSLPFAESFYLKHNPEFNSFTIKNQIFQTMGF